MASKPRLSATIRIVLSLVSLSTSLLLFASSLGLIPDRSSDIMEGRARLCESMALNFSTLARYSDATTMKSCFEAIVQRNPQIVSLGLRRESGELIFAISDHDESWNLASNAMSTETQLAVPVFANNKPWGTLEVQFVPISKPGLSGILLRPEFKLAGYMTIMTLIAYYLFLRKVLRQLNPSKVIPGRVREAFDSLAEGLIVMDQKECIVLANRAFEMATGHDVSQLVGRRVSDIPFVQRESTSNETFPWHETIKHSKAVKGRLLSLKGESTETKTFSVSAAPIFDDQGGNRGALASFEDVSGLERQKEELRAMVEQLHSSSEKIHQQNRDLQVLATCDPLTGCFNRRMFLGQFDQIWSSAQRYGHSLSAIMVDVDHFKSVNDKYGHSMGDEVLRQVAAELRACVRDADVVCRFGGEEFAILLPHTDLVAAESVAEKLRCAIAALKFPQLSVTASLGVSSTCQSPNNPQELLEQCDKSMYVAKRSGRNQVFRWDRIPSDFAMEAQEVSHAAILELPDDAPSIPFHAVTALISALAYRDQGTAAHSRRVADLCVATAEGLLSLKECYVLEIAALLHDIGKIGVPDTILLKTTPLSEAEWNIMHSHDRIGVEIIRTSFQSPALSQIVEFHRNHFGEKENHSGQLTGQAIPIGARILAIADAYDSITSDLVYRKGRDRTAAFEELRRCAGAQFDPEIVERFIVTVERLQGQQHNQATRVSTEAALSIGMQLERLVEVLDRQNLEEIQVLSQRLSATAKKYGAREIADKAAELDACLKSDHNLLGFMQAANELLDLCRSTQSSFFRAESTICAAP